MPVTAVRVLAALLAAFVLAAPASAADLRTDIDAILADARLQNAQVGVLVRDARTGRSLYARGADRQLLPASNQKLPTAAAALGILGPGHTFRTSVLAGPRDGGTVPGDLYLRGTGDPTLRAADYDALAAAVAAQGITTVEGRLVADATWFDDQHLAPDWDPADEPFAYAAQVSALTLSPNPELNAGSIEVSVAPAQQGQPVAVAVSPATDYVTIDNRATTGAPGSPSSLAISRIRGTNTITVTGSHPAGGATVRVLRTVDDPALYAAAIFRAALGAHGVRVQGETVRGATPPQATEVTARTSPPLGQLAVPFLKLSNNNIAEILVKAIGRETADEGSWEAGLPAIAAYVRRLGVDPSQIRLTDGSGLSRGNRTTPRQIGNLLRAVRRRTWFPAFSGALPLAGQPDPLVGGTLSARMRDTPAAGNVRAKTGSLTGVTALSGYVTDPRRRPLIFSIVFNGYQGPAPKDLEDRIAVRLAAGRGAEQAVQRRAALLPTGGEGEISWADVTARAP